MSAILLNSGGGIHVDNGNILLADPLSPEDCECCGPPQPPEPDCIRCPNGTNPDGTVNYDEPIDYNISLQVSDVTDKLYFKITQRYERYGAFPFDHPCRWQQGINCEDHYIDFEEEIEVTGFSALNGTYYGTRKELPVDFPSNPDNGFGGLISSLADCNGTGLPFNPFDYPDSLCSSEPLCTRYCRERIWIKDVPLTGVYKCKRTIYWNCSNGIAPYTFTVEHNIPLEGWSNLYTRYDNVNKYGTNNFTNAQPSIMMWLRGLYPQGPYNPSVYVNRYSFNIDFLCFGVDLLNTSTLPPETVDCSWRWCPRFEQTCDPDTWDGTPATAAYNTMLFNRCGFGSGVPFNGEYNQGFDCGPFWRNHFYPMVTKCPNEINNEPINTSHSYSCDGCDVSDKRVNTLECVPGFPCPPESEECGPTWWSNEYTINKTPFQAQFDMLWSPA